MLLEKTGRGTQNPPLLFLGNRFSGGIDSRIVSGFHLHEGNILLIGGDYVYFPQPCTVICRQDIVSPLPQKAGGQYFTSRPVILRFQPAVS